MNPEFRVWDKLTQKYWNIENWHFEDEYLDLIESGVSIADPNIERVWRKFNEVELMQYTGLKDVEGHKIFEGDIVESIDEEWSTGGLTTGTVQYLAPQFTFDSAGVGRPGIWKVLDDGCRVIGNIHENLELMEEDK